MHKTTMLLAGLCLAFLFGSTSMAPAQGSTGGKVTLESKSIAFLVGVNWNDGTLEYRGQKHLFTVEGLSVLDLGVTKVAAQGEVKNLKKLEDFSGTYTLAPGGGTGATTLKNENGVEVALTPATKGMRFTQAKGGVEIKLKK
jgi:hypothetical protein